MIPSSVLLTNDATHDLRELHDYISQHDSPRKAGAVLDRIEDLLQGLAQSPERGPYAKELIALGIREHRQVAAKPYRIIYRVIGEKVYVMLFAYRRRDMQSLLERRLLEVD